MLSMRHWNRRRLVTIGIMTTGPDPGWHDVVELSAMVWDSSINYCRDVLPFHIFIRPEFPERSTLRETKLVEYVHHGVSRQDALDYFMLWVDGLKVGQTKWGTPRKMNLLTYNAAKVVPFVENLFRQGYDDSGNQLFWQLFHEWYIDLLPIGHYINDYLAMRGDPVRYNKLTDDWLGNVHAQNIRQVKSALRLAMLYGNTYRELLGTAVRNTSAKSSCERRTDPTDQADEEGSGGDEENTFPSWHFLDRQGSDNL